jgi:hypothetical protein
MRKSFGGIALAIGLLAVLSASAFADETVASQYQIIAASKIYSTNAARTGPLTQLAACLPQGSSCSKGGDCCSGNCDPKHNKCAR